MHLTCQFIKWYLRSTHPKKSIKCRMKCMVGRNGKCVKLNSWLQIPAEMKANFFQNFPSELCGFITSVNILLFFHLFCAFFVSFRKIWIKTGSVPVLGTKHRYQKVSTCTLYIWNCLTNCKDTFYSLVFLLVQENVNITTNVKCTKMYSAKHRSTEEFVISHVILKLARRLWSTGSVS